MLKEVTDKELLEQWAATWPKALAIWSRYTRLSNPLLCLSEKKAAQEGLTDSFAMIRFSDQGIVVNLEKVKKLELTDYALEILAHEIGHHVLAPANVTDHFLLLARIRKALPTLEIHAAMVSNLYTDLLINDRLQRRHGLRISEVYQKMVKPESQTHKPSVWSLYMRIYEYLWQLDKGLLSGNIPDEKFHVDAWLGARIIRVYANEWMDGGSRFATLLLPYLVNEIEQSELIKGFLDTKDSATDCEPSGLTEIDDGELEDCVHPINDPRITGEETNEDDKNTPNENIKGTSVRGWQRREVFDYGEILKSAGIKLNDHEIAVRYYREAALPYLVSFPTQISIEGSEPLIEGLAPWELGNSFDEIDWMETIFRSPVVFPGLTTVQREYGFIQGENPKIEPIDLDIYVDSSGSMPNPQVKVSYLALAGAIISLSALRAGSKVQATLWSGKGEFFTTKGFIQNENEILSVLTGYFGSSTAFPIHILRKTFSERKPTDRACHILMISDDGITTMFDKDEKGNSGWDISQMALEKGRAGGTMALNMPVDWESMSHSEFTKLKKARSIQKWNIHAIEKMEDLIHFASEFSKKYFSQKK